MSTTSPRSSRHHPRFLTTLAACCGVIILAAGSAAAQGWNPGPAPAAPGSHHYHPAPPPVHRPEPAPVVYACDSTVDIRPGMVEHGLAVNTRGAVDCDDVTGTFCPGYVSRRPICLDVRRGTRLDIEVTGADVDTVLALVGPGVVHTDDDGGRGTNSRITRYLGPGQYRLHVGTYARRDRGSVSLALRDADAPRYEPPRRGHGRGHGHGHGHAVVYDAAAACPASAQVVRLSPYQTTGWVSTVASGEVDSSDRMGRFESGWVPSRAQICLVVDEAGYYDVEVTNSETDTVLGIVPIGGGSALFDDDGGTGWLSRVSGYLNPGAYHVYVGTFGYHMSAPAQVVLSRR